MMLYFIIDLFIFSKNVGNRYRYLSTHKVWIQNKDCHPHGYEDGYMYFFNEYEDEYYNILSIPYPLSSLLSYNVW
jgi:hypothetical protein